MAWQDFSERDAQQELAETEPYEAEEWERECAEFERWLDQLNREFPEYDWTQEHEHGSGQTSSQQQPVSGKE
jgi:hypothetical protein